MDIAEGWSLIWYWPSFFSFHKVSSISTYKWDKEWLEQAYQCRIFFDFFRSPPIWYFKKITVIIWSFKFPFVYGTFSCRIFHLDFSALFWGVNLIDTRGVWKTVGYKTKSTGFWVLALPVPLNYCVNQGRFFPPQILVSLCTIKETNGLSKFFCRM